MVIILITPPIASEPYISDAGPRIISTFSIIETGGKNPLVESNPLPSKAASILMRLPSINIRVYLLDIPRICIDEEPVLLIDVLTPGISWTISPRSLMGRF